MNRRQFIGLLGGTAATPTALYSIPLSAQQATLPVIGYLNPSSAALNEPNRAVFVRALAEAGFVEGRNVIIDYRWADGQYDRLPAMAADLVRRKVTVIVATTNPAGLAAKAATANIPIVFTTTDDPVRLGLVASLARPGGNATGVRFFLSNLGSKQLGLLREIVPKATRVGLLINPGNVNAEDITKEVIEAGAALGVQIDVARVRDTNGIDAAILELSRNKVDALMVGADPFFFHRRLQLATLTIRHGIPTIFNVREYAEVGGLMSYGTSLSEVFRLVGNYTARLLKGDKPANLPAVQTTKFELVVNLITAKALGVEVPATFLARTDEVIE